MKTVMRTRNDFAALLNELGLTGNAVEIGVAEAHFSHFILDNWPGRMFQVDPWAILTTPGFSGHGEDSEAGMEKRYRRILELAKRYNKTGEQPRCVPMRMTSEEAAVEFQVGFFDFVYLDAAHNYDSIKQDIELWWPKVRRSGILAGHDHLDGVFHGQEYGVKRAVKEFAAGRGLVVSVTQETDWPSFWIVKP